MRAFGSPAIFCFLFLPQRHRGHRGEILFCQINSVCSVTLWLIYFYPTTSIPMLRAVPEMTRNAASSFVVFMSLDFILMMSRTCLRVTLPTLSLFGTFEPAVMPAAFFKRIDAGGDLVMN